MTHHNEKEAIGGFEAEMPHPTPTDELAEAVKRIAKRMKDAEPYREIWSDEFKVIAQQAAIIERQQAEIAKLKSEAESGIRAELEANEERGRLYLELDEQCRINCLGGERELALMAKVEQQREALKLAREGLCRIAVLSTTDVKSKGIAIDNLTAIDNVMKGE